MSTNWQCYRLIGPSMWISAGRKRRWLNWRWNTICDTELHRGRWNKKKTEWTKREWAWLQKYSSSALQLVQIGQRHIYRQFFCFFASFDYHKNAHSKRNKFGQLFAMFLLLLEFKCIQKWSGCGGSVVSLRKSRMYRTDAPNIYWHFGFVKLETLISTGEIGRHYVHGGKGPKAPPHVTFPWGMNRREIENDKFNSRFGRNIQTDRFLKTDLKEPVTLGKEVPMLDGNSGGMELRPMSEPSIRLMVNTDFFRWRPVAQAATPQGRPPPPPPPPPPAAGCCCCCRR